MASAKIRDIEKCKKAVLDICTPKDVFPSDSEGDTLWKLNSEVDELFDELNANILIIKDYYYSGVKQIGKLASALRLLLSKIIR